MQKNERPPLRIAIMLLIILQVSCQTFSPTPVATIISTDSATPAEATATQTAVATEALEFSDQEIMEGIQASLDRYAEAYRDNNGELLEQVVDQENKPFRRIVRSRFDDFQGSYQAGQIEFQFRLIEIIKREYGFVLGHFETDDGLAATWPFRYIHGAWVISEPTVEQIGAPVTTETEHFILTTYPWADDVNRLIMERMEIARQNVEKVLGKVPEEKANVEIMPIYGLHPFDPMYSIAIYKDEREPADDIIQIYTPYSFGYSYYDAKRGWEKELEQILTHEYTHMTHVRAFDGAGHLSDWMSEGLAEFVSGADQNSYSACDAMVSGTFIPILDETRNIYQQDLMHMFLLQENLRLSYDFATSLVEFTVENYGGLDGFWKLAEASDQTSDFKKAVQDAFGIPYDEYSNKWQAWLKKKC